MARGESQTLLIWTIVFLVLLLVMIIVTVVVRGKLVDAAAQFADAETKNKQLTSDNNKLKQDLGNLMARIGFPDANLPIADVETAHNKDIELYAASLPQDGSTTYRTVLQMLDKSLKDQVNVNKSQTMMNTNLQAEIKLNNEKNEALRQQLQAMVDQAQAGLLKAQADHQKQLDDLMDEKQKLIAQANDAIAASNKNRDDAKEGMQKAERIRDNVMFINNQLTDIVAKIDSPALTYTDARILWVSADSTKVTVNLGSNHGLRVRMPFSVYGADVKEISKTMSIPMTDSRGNEIGSYNKEISVGSGKAKIEITKIIDGNTAEASVTDEILMNPILPGDIIYTPIWRPGQRIHVALSSGMDLDGDGIPDPDKVLMLIKMCGGEVDAYIDDLTGETFEENGKMVRKVALYGEVTRETRYLVVGNTPDPDSSVTLFDARRELDSKAKEYGAKEISLNDLLSLMGQRPQSQRVGFGPRNRATNDYIMVPEVINQRMPGKVFDKFENPKNFDQPGINPPFTNKQTPISPLFNQRPVSQPTGTVSPLFQPRTPSGLSADTKS